LYRIGLPASDNDTQQTSAELFQRAQKGDKGALAKVLENIASVQKNFDEYR
jgi:hypothetical protein